MYLDKNPYKFNTVLKMHDNCSHCNLKYQIEPSFFYGAMYVSYGLNVAISIAAFIIAFVFIGLSIKTSFISIIVANIILYPIVLRLSRNIYINIFVDYDKDKK